MFSTYCTRKIGKACDVVDVVKAAVNLSLPTHPHNDLHTEKSKLASTVNHGKCHSGKGIAFESRGVLKCQEMDNGGIEIDVAFRG